MKIMKSVSSDITITAKAAVKNENIIESTVTTNEKISLTSSRRINFGNKKRQSIPTAIDTQISKDFRIIFIFCLVAICPQKMEVVSLQDHSNLYMNQF